jgi:predicted ArsR family transcriptional regulator
MVNPTRQRILDYLVEHRKASAPELSQALNMTRPNMRYHIERLHKEGLIEVMKDHPSEKSRGRPVLTYCLAVTARPNNLPQLAHLLLQDYFQDDQETGQIDLEARMRSLAQKLTPIDNRPRTMTQRLTWLVQILNQKNYQARWEAHASTPVVQFRNCPYAAILHDHPELCRMDAFFLEHLTGTPFIQKIKMDINSNRPPVCVFILQEERKKLTS